MAQPNTYLPSIQDLGTQFGIWNPMTYTQAVDNEGLAAQFRNQSYMQEQNQTQKGTLENQHDAAMNPLLQGQQRGVNTKQDIANSEAGLVLERNLATQPQALKLAIQKAATALDDQDIKDMGNHITKVLTNKDGIYTQADKDQAIKMQQFMPEIMAAKRAHADAMEKEKELTRRHLQGITQQGANAVELANVNNAAGRYAKKGSGGVSIVDNLWSGKMKVAERLGAVKAILETGQHPDEDRELTSLERRSLQALYDQDAATTEGKLAMQAQGITAKANTAGGVEIVNKDKPSVRTGSTPPTPNHSLATVQQQYPGVPPEKLRELYKKKFGVDLK